MRKWIAAALAAAGLSFVLVANGANAGPTTNPTTAAQFGGGWLARQVNSQGFIPAASGNPSYSSTVDAALALAASKVGGNAFDRVMAFMHAHIDDFVEDSGGVDLPGSLAKLIMLAVAAGEDPRNFAGNGASNNLVQRLKDTETTSGKDAGLFGSQDPSFDGAFRQSLALMALVAAGAVPDASAINWLKTQQCADKGWQSYRADVTKACDSTDPTTFAGEDTNSTAIAEQAFATLAVAPPQGNPLDFLKDAQNSDGGFGFLKGTSTDANSTGLSLQAIVAGNENPAAGRWVVAGNTPFTALLALQVGCDAAEKDRGAFDFQQESPLKPNLLATVQAVPGAGGQPFPLDPGRPANDEPTACAPAPTTTTTSTTTSTTVVPATTTTTALSSSAVQATADNAATSPVATPIVATPRLTG